MKVKPIFKLKDAIVKQLDLYCNDNYYADIQVNGAIATFNMLYDIENFGGDEELLFEEIENYMFLKDYFSGRFVEAEKEIGYYKIQKKYEELLRSEKRGTLKPNLDVFIDSFFTKYIECIEDKSLNYNLYTQEEVLDTLKIICPEQLDFLEYSIYFNFLLSSLKQLKQSLKDKSKDNVPQSELLADYRSYYEYSKFAMEAIYDIEYIDTLKEFNRDDREINCWY